MARIVKHRRSGPYRIESAEFPLFICGCGLSRRPPYCDGAHKYCRWEEEGKTYTYDDQRQAAEIDETGLPELHEIPEEDFAG